MSDETTNSDFERKVQTAIEKEQGLRIAVLEQQLKQNDLKHDSYMQSLYEQQAFRSREESSRAEAIRQSKDAYDLHAMHLAQHTAMLEAQVAHVAKMAEDMHKICECIHQVSHVLWERTNR
jgi:hypothetical protein